MDIQIIEFEEKYADEIKQLETNQWGCWDDEEKIQQVKENEIVLVALVDDKFAGFSSGELNCDVFHLKISCLKPQFQKCGIGSLLLKKMMQKAKQKFKFLRFKAEAISVYGKCNAKKLLENFGFKNTKVDKCYWGKLYPNVQCKECLKKPCECDSLVYELDNLEC